MLRSGIAENVTKPSTGKVVGFVVYDLSKTLQDLKTEIEKKSFFYASVLVDLLSVSRLSRCFGY